MTNPASAAPQQLRSDVLHRGWSRQVSERRLEVFGDFANDKLDDSSDSVLHQDPGATSARSTQPLESPPGGENDITYGLTGGAELPDPIWARRSP